MSLHNAHPVAHPLGDLVDRDSGACKQAREGVSHDMGCDPWASHGLHVLLEGALEVVSVKAAAFFDIGGKHVGGAQSECLDKFFELLGEGDCSLLAVFKIKSCVFLRVQGSRAKIEPFGLGFHNFVKSQTSMKSTKQNIFEFLSRALGNQAVSKLGGAEFFSRCRFRGLDLLGASLDSQREHGVRVAGALDFLAPVEKPLNGHQVSVGGALGNLGASLIVIGENLVGRDFGGFHASRPFRPRAQDGNLCVKRGGRPLARGFAKRGVFLDREFNVRSVGHDIGGVEVGDAGDGFKGVGGFQRHEGSSSVDLSRIPVGVPAQVESFDFNRGLAHRVWKKCYNFIVTLHCHTFKFCMALYEGIWIKKRACEGDAACVVRWCAMGGSNSRPLPCQYKFSVGNVTLFCHTLAAEVSL